PPPPPIHPLPTNTHCLPPPHNHPTELLQKAGLTVSGKKDDLIERLMKHDQQKQDASNADELDKQMEAELASLVPKDDNFDDFDDDTKINLESTSYRRKAISTPSIPQFPKPPQPLPPPPPPLPAPSPPPNQPCHQSPSPKPAASSSRPSASQPRAPQPTRTPPLSPPPLSPPLRSLPPPLSRRLRCRRHLALPRPLSTRSKPSTSWKNRRESWSAPGGLVCPSPRTSGSCSARPNSVLPRRSQQSSPRLRMICLQPPPSRLHQWLRGTGLRRRCVSRSRPSTPR
ncbi:hypothetical protein BC938DRAFT_476932, partial [Jimgerdemannia flammicorona]